jgi:ADP-ribosylglycohydrolase
MLIFPVSQANQKFSFSEMSDIKKRKLGALLGVHAGDSLGASLEFVPWENTRGIFPNGLRSIVGGGPFDWPAGHATDDTDLTRAVLLAYTENTVDDIVYGAADNMLSWKQGVWPGRQPGSRPVDIGGATLIGLSRYERIKDPRNCGAGNGSAGNGSLMRCIPTAIFTADVQKRRKESMEISAVTHNDARCTVACAAYNDIVAALIDGTSAEEAVTAGLEYAKDEGECPAVVRAIELGQSLKPEKLVVDGPDVFTGRAKGYVLESLALAIAAVLDKRSFVDVLSDIVMLGGDADTNGAIAGGLLGARDGVDAIPSDWIEKLQFGKEFIDIMEKAA